jgi:hypothetical protein
MIKNGTYLKEEVMKMVEPFGHFTSQNLKRTIWQKDGVQVTASYYDFISAKYWDVKVKKIA